MQIDGEGWLPTRAIGCDEYVAGAVTGPLNVTARAPRPMSSWAIR